MTQFGDEAWWRMVAGTVAALHVEERVPLTAETAAHLLFLARERGSHVEELRAWLTAQPRPVLPPAPPVPPLPPVPPVPASDAIDLADAVITDGSPDVRSWPIGTTLTEFGLSPDGMTINFPKRNGVGAWPFVIGKEGGDVQYTLWVGCRIGRRWHLSAVLLCISRGDDDNYVPTGPVLEPGQLPNEWYFFAGDPLATYQPQPGELVAWFVTSGEQRRVDNHVTPKGVSTRERSNIVVAPFAAGRFV